MATKKYRCKVCGYIHEGNKAPDVCPVCQAPASEFEELGGKKLNTNSNTYTMLYAAIMVVVVAAVLAFTALQLKPMQQKNIEIDKMTQILSSVGISSTALDAEKIFAKYIVGQIIVNEQGQEVSAGGAFDVSIKDQVSLPCNERKLPVYICQLDDNTKKYILPMYGAGLWGPIWGYLSVDQDGNTVYGATFAHQGETPGLGAEISQSKFIDQFKGKHLFVDGVFRSVMVQKVGTKPLNNEDYVDAVSGGTITSKGVESMMLNSLAPYANYLKELNNQMTTTASVDSQAVVVEEVIEVIE